LDPIRLLTIWRKPKPPQPSVPPRSLTRCATPYLQSGGKIILVTNGIETEFPGGEPDGAK